MPTPQFRQPAPSPAEAMDPQEQVPEYDQEGLPNAVANPIQRKKMLGRGFDNVRRDKARTKIEASASLDEVRRMKIELVQKFFDMLQQSGVNPNDPNSIKDFLDRLERIDPDLVIMLEVALRGLDPEQMNDSIFHPQAMDSDVEQGDMGAAPQAAPAGMPSPAGGQEDIMQRFQGLSQQMGQ